MCKKTLISILILFALLLSSCNSAKLKDKSEIDSFPYGTIELEKSDYEIAKEKASKYTTFDRNKYGVSYFAMHEFLSNYYQTEVEELEIYFIADNTDSTKTAAYYKADSKFYISKVDNELLWKMMVYKNKFVEPMIEMSESGTLVLSVLGKNYPS